MSVKKKFKVRGYAMVPVEVEMTIEAPDAAAAMHNSTFLFKMPGRKKFVVPNSQDEAAVCDFGPVEVVEIL